MTSKHFKTTSPWLCKLSFVNSALFRGLSTQPCFVVLSTMCSSFPFTLGITNDLCISLYSLKVLVFFVKTHHMTFFTLQELTGEVRLLHGLVLQCEPDL